MFREMRRFKQALTEPECIAVLKEQKRGVLSMLGDDGYPYGIPLDHWYNEADGKLYFHGAKEGHKIDAILACDKVSYCVIDEGHTEGDDWPLHFKSVIVFGRIKPVESSEKTLEVCAGIGHRFTSDESYLAHEYEHSMPHVLCLELTPEHITGKRIKEC